MLQADTGGVNAILREAGSKYQKGMRELSSVATLALTAISARH
jgi:hypothetical protein